MEGEGKGLFYLNKSATATTGHADDDDDFAGDDEDASTIGF